MNFMIIDLELTPSFLFSEVIQPFFGCKYEVCFVFHHHCCAEQVLGHVVQIKLNEISTVDVRYIGLFKHVHPISGSG